MSTETDPQPAAPKQREAPAETEESSEADAPAGAQEEEDARYASQAAAAQPSPVAFEGGASVPGDSGGTTGRSEWIFLLLSVLFSLALVAIPAVFFTSIDLTAAAEGAGANPAAEQGGEQALEIQRLQLLQETRADALSKLYTYGPAEDDSTAFRIPVERAMRLTRREIYAASAAAPGERAGPIVVPADSAAAR